MSVSEPKIFRIFPNIRIKHSSNGYFLEKYRPKKNDWNPIAFIDESLYKRRAKYIEELTRLIVELEGEME